MIAFLRSMLFTLLFYLGSVPIVVTALLIAPLGQPAVIGVARFWAQYHAACARWLLGVRTVVDGVLPSGAVIVAMKHEAMYETVELLRLFDRPAVVFKAELARVPVWGRVALSHGVIPVAREAGSAALRQMLKAARDAVAKGRPIVIFPEGTRVPPGERPPLRAGIAGLYKQLGLPIVPVSLDSGRLWPRHSFTKHAGVITMKVGEAIPPGLPREEVEARVHAGINALVAPQETSRLQS